MINIMKKLSKTKTYYAITHEGNKLTPCNYVRTCIANMVQHYIMCDADGNEFAVYPKDLFETFDEANKSLNAQNETNVHIVNIDGTKNKKRGMKYEAVFLERPGASGLNRNDAITLINMLGDHEFYPLEIQNSEQESCAMGFITKHAAAKLQYDYSENSDFQLAAKRVLADMTLENDSRTYDFCGVTTYLNR